MKFKYNMLPTTRSGRTAFAENDYTKVNLLKKCGMEKSVKKLFVYTYLRKMGFICLFYRGKNTRSVISNKIKNQRKQKNHNSLSKNTMIIRVFSPPNPLHPLFNNTNLRETFIKVDQLKIKQEPHNEKTYFSSNIISKTTQLQLSPCFNKRWISYS